MEAQRQKHPSVEVAHQNHQELPAFPAVPTGPLRSRESTSPRCISPRDAMNIDNLISPQMSPKRASSVNSRMSFEDLQAAEALESLKMGNIPSEPQGAPPPQWAGTESEYPANQQEPLLHLLTSQVPLLSSAVNGSMYAYSQTKSYSPVIRYPAEFLERKIGHPVAGTIGAVGRKTGVEGGLRWALQGKRRKPSHGAQSPSKKEEMDIERGILSPPQSDRRSSLASDTLPLYDEFGDCPPYQEKAQIEEQQRQVVLQSHQNQTPPGWQTRLMVSTSGLGVAMSEQSRRNLKYCISWLRWANERLATVIVAVTKVLKDLEQQQTDSTETDADGHPQNQSAIAARLQALSLDIAETVKKAVVEVSKYAGGALPQNARDLVHRYFNSLPHRWHYASTLADTNAETQNENETVSNGRRVLAIAQEGLSMMMQVTVVVNDTLTSAETWCERLGKKNNNNNNNDNNGGDIKNTNGSTAIGSHQHGPLEDEKLLLKHAHGNHTDGANHQHQHQQSDETSAVRSLSVAGDVTMGDAE